VLASISNTGHERHRDGQIGARGYRDKVSGHTAISAPSMILNGACVVTALVHRRLPSQLDRLPNPACEENTYHVKTIRDSDRCPEETRLLLSRGAVQKSLNTFAVAFLIQSHTDNLASDPSTFRFGKTRSRHVMLLCLKAR
jgi:hypothetical protein